MSRPSESPKPEPRLARPEDGAALCELFARVTMDADLRLAVERDPDFFALYDLQEVERRVWIADVGGSIEGIAALLGRDGWLEGSRCRVGYAGDLRFGEALRGGFFLGRMFGEIFGDACDAFGCEAMLTAVIDSNRLAKAALVRRTRRFPDKPVYRPLRSFHILNIQMTTRGRPRPTDLTVRRATEDDVAAIAARLEEDHRARPFGYCFDEALLRKRLARWPGLTIDSFYVAHDGAGRLRGVAAPWDAGPVKRFRVLAYEGRMRWIKRAFNLGAFFARFPPLPPPGGLFRYVYLTHVSIAEDDPATMAALLDRIYHDLHGSGRHFICAYVERDDPLAPAFARYRTTALPATLYVMSRPGSRWNDLDLGPGRPGFEMALV